MVLKKLLSSLGFGGVEVDTVLALPSTRPGSPLTGQVHLRAKGDVEITSIHLLLIATGAGQSEVELARYLVSDLIKLPGGTTHAVPFNVTVPFSAPVTSLYGQRLPGIAIGVRTEVSVAAGSAKTDFDPTVVEPTDIHQHVLDALGAIGCRFVRNDMRPGSVVGLATPVVQSIVFYAPVPEGQPVGPHIPQLVFSFAPDAQGVTVIAELASRLTDTNHHRVPNTDLPDDPSAWLDIVDGWVRDVLEKLTQAPRATGSFLQTPTQVGGHGRPGGGSYAYGGHGHQGGYRYDGHRSRGGAGSMIAAGVGGAAMGFLGGMLIADMMTPDMADMGGAAEESAGDAGFDSAGFEDSGFSDFGGDFGGDF